MEPEPILQGNMSPRVLLEPLGPGNPSIRPRASNTLIKCLPIRAIIAAEPPPFEVSASCSSGWRQFFSSVSQDSRDNRNKKAANEGPLKPSELKSPGWSLPGGTEAAARAGAWLHFASPRTLEPASMTRNTLAKGTGARGARVASTVPLTPRGRCACPAHGAGVHYVQSVGLGSPTPSCEAATLFQMRKWELRGLSNLHRGTQLIKWPC